MLDTLTDDQEWEEREVVIGTDIGWAWPMTVVTARLPLVGVVVWEVGTPRRPGRTWVELELTGIE
jgi:hypothetical protein